MDAPLLHPADARGLQLPVLAPGPLGTVGNLQFNVQNGGTARASGLGACSCIGAFLSDLIFHLGCPSERARAQREHKREVFENSRCIGDLLGKLTAHANDAAGLSRLARHLVTLSELSQGDLANLPGGCESLSAYVDELTVRDTLALREGALGVPQAVLAQISSGELRVQAAGVLTQVERALDQRAARDVVHQPLWCFVEEGIFEGKSEKELKEVLLPVHSHRDKLETYLTALSIGQLEVLRNKMSDRLEEMKKAPLWRYVHLMPLASAILDEIRASLRRQTLARDLNEE